MHIKCQILTIQFLVKLEISQVGSSERTRIAHQGRMEPQSMVCVWIFILVYDNCLCVYVRVCVCTYVWIYVCAYMCTYVRSYARTYTRMCARMCALMHARTYTRTYAITPMHASTHASTDARTHARTHICTYLRTYVCMHAGMHAWIHTCPARSRNISPRSARDCPGPPSPATQHNTIQCNVRMYGRMYASMYILREDGDREGITL